MGLNRTLKGLHLRSDIGILGFKGRLKGVIILLLLRLIQLLSDLILLTFQVVYFIPMVLSKPIFRRLFPIFIKQLTTKK